MDELTAWFERRWPRFMVMLGVFLLALSLLMYKLRTAFAGVSPLENNYIESTRMIRTIWEHPTSPLHKGAQYVLHKLDLHGTFAMRSVSVVFAIIALGFFWSLLKRWHSQRIATLGTLLLCSSSWFLVTARHATDIVFFVVSPLMMLWGWQLLGRRANTAKQWWRVALAGSFVLLGLYTPLMLWWAIVLVAWQPKLPGRAALQLPTKYRALVIGIWMAIVLPLLVRAITSIGFARDLVGIPAILPSPLDFIRNVGQVAFGLFIRSKEMPELNVGRLPLLDAVSVLFVVLGAYFYLVGHRRLLRTWQLVSGGAILLFMSSLSDHFGSFTALLPLLYLGIAAGVAVLLKQWFVVFPHNPVARSVGFSIVLAIVSLSSLYQLNRYFIAWRHYPEARAVYIVTPRAD